MDDDGIIISWLRIEGEITNNPFFFILKTKFFLHFFFIKKKCVYLHGNYVQGT